MRITFDKDMKVHEVLEILENLIEEVSEEYPILKTKMTIDISLKDDIGDINPKNERLYSFGKGHYEKIEAIKKKDADDRLQDEWKSYTSDYTYRNLVNDIEAAKKYIETANQNNRSLINVENRKSLLLRSEKKLVKEKERLESLKRFIDLINKNEAEYKYIEYFPGQWVKIIIFKLEDSYIFSYEPDVYGECCLRKIDNTSN